MEENHSIRFEVLFVGGCEIAAAALTVLVYVLLGYYDWTVLSGAALGVVCALANFLILAMAVDRAVNRVMRTRKDGEMTEEESEKFAAENRAGMQRAIQLSFLIRTALLIGALVLAFLSGWFSPIATVVPLLLYTPFLTLSQTFRKK